MNYVINLSFHQTHVHLLTLFVQYNIPGPVSGEINENSPCIMIKSTRDLSILPPTYGQTQDKNLPSYDEVTVRSNNAKNFQGS